MNFNSNTSLVVASEPDYPSQTDSNEATLSHETKQNMLLEMLKCTLVTVKANEVIKAEEVY
jgi:hypothetical protein